MQQKIYWEDRIRKAHAKEEYSLIPQRTIETLILWVTEGISGGSFFNALVSNNLENCINFADDENVRALAPTVKMLYNHVPADCHGSPDKAKRWEGLGEENV